MIKIKAPSFFSEYEEIKTIVISENIEGNDDYFVSLNTMSGLHIEGTVSGSELEGRDTVDNITLYGAVINNNSERFNITLLSESIKEFTNDCELCIEEITRYSIDTDVVSTKTPLYMINHKTGEELVVRYSEAKTFEGISFDSFDKRVIVKPSDIIDGIIELYIIDSPDHKCTCTCSCECKKESSEIELPPQMNSCSRHQLYGYSIFLS